MKRDLLLIVPGKDNEQALRGLIEDKRVALGIREISYEVIKDNKDNDSGVFNNAAWYARPYIGDVSKVLTVFDRHGCGKDGEDRKEIQDKVEKDLRKNGWEGCCKSIVIDPELERWIWVKSQRLAEEVGWGESICDLYRWLREERYLEEGFIKPEDPKAALDAVRRRVKRPKSPRLYRNIAAKCSFKDCADDAFDELRSTLRDWFPEVSDNP